MRQNYYEEATKFLIKNVLYVRKSKNSLLSINKVVEAGYSVTLNDKNSYISDKNGDIILKLNFYNKQYFLQG